MSNRQRPLSPTQRAMLTALADGAVFTESAGKAVVKHPDGRRTPVAWQTWSSLMRRGLIAWHRREIGSIVARITARGRVALAATPAGERG